MGFNFFLSVSGDENSESRAIAKNLAEKLSKREYADSVYYFTEPKRVGDLWQQGLAENLASAEILIPLVDKNYLASRYCFLEFYHFINQAKNMAEQLNLKGHHSFVWPIFLQKQSSLKKILSEIDVGGIAKSLLAINQNAQNLKLDEQSEVNVENEINKWHNNIINNINTFYALVTEDPDARSKDTLAEEKSGLIKAFNRSMKEERFRNLGRKLRNRIDRKENLEILKTAERLCVFALRMDRYHDGGWGFSLGELFERDSDGNDLPHGLYENNIFILNSLIPYFTNRQYLNEFYDSLKQKSQASDSRLPVSDRKPINAQASCFFLRPKDMAGHASTIIETLIREKRSKYSPLERWKIKVQDNRTLGETALIFNLYAILSDAQNNEIRAVIIDGIQAMRTEVLRELSEEQNIDVIVDELQRWAAEGYKTLREGVINALPTGYRIIDLGRSYQDDNPLVFSNRSFREFSQELIGFIMLSESEKGRRILKNWANSVHRTNMAVLDFEEL